MSGGYLRLAVLIAIAGMLVVGGFAGAATASEHVEEEPCDACIEGPDEGEDDSESTATFGGAAFEQNDETATRVGKAFLQAKKAFHEARQEIQAIEKGEESPVEDVPTFFQDDDEENDGDD